MSLDTPIKSQLFSKCEEKKKKTSSEYYLHFLLKFCLLWKSRQQQKKSDNHVMSLDALIKNKPKANFFQKLW